MRISSLKLENFRSFEQLELTELGQLNIFVGKNNAGKSSILRAIYYLQSGMDFDISDIRAASNESKIIIELENMSTIYWFHNQNFEHGIATISIEKNRPHPIQIHIVHEGNVYGATQIQNKEPHHFIIPFLSKRKATGYSESVNLDLALSVIPNMHHLSAKLSRIANPHFPVHEIYSKACKDILGFVVTSITSTNGQRAGMYLPDGKSIYIDQMGEGVPNIVSLLVELSLSKDKLFLIEEPENDLHPEALKSLLDLIITSSERNQFMISTHSNIVVSYLAAAKNSKLFNITTEKGVLPTLATIHEVERTVEARLTVLRELGYSFSDFELWDGWLLLEESSAERIIRDYLIPWFAPKLTRIRTLSAGGVSKVGPTFEDFNRLVRYTHLEEAYRNAVWVRVDGDEPGQDIIRKLQDGYKTWEIDSFKCFNQEQFEYYYPYEFSTKVKEIFDSKDKNRRKEEKRILLDKVRKWLDEDEERGKTALQESAAEVIDDLITIERKLSQRLYK